eukprot:909032-Pyramimonas_sp.AAC.1
MGEGLGANPGAQPMVGVGLQESIQDDCAGQVTILPPARPKQGQHREPTFVALDLLPPRSWKVHSAWGPPKSM